MCGIAGIFDFSGTAVPNLNRRLDAMGELIAHRGPDDDGVWVSAKRHAGLAHRRLSVIDLTANAHQPMVGPDGSVIAFNGEIYNYRSVRQNYQGRWDFQSQSDTEAILAGYAHKGTDICHDLNGMFAFAIWDETSQKLILARDRCGIKPLYYTVIGSVLYFASEVKALLPFMPDISINPEALSNYLMLQLQLGEETLFAGIQQLSPGTLLTVDEHGAHVTTYWDIQYKVGEETSDVALSEKLSALMSDSLQEHLTADVPIGAHLSGGIDSSIIASLSRGMENEPQDFFHGCFLENEGFDESLFARAVVDEIGGNLNVVDISADDFRDNIEKVIYHLDYPVAGPGSFPQFMVAKMASEKVKVVLAGQGGDELFAGYARYQLAYFEQCILATINGTYDEGEFVVTPQSIIPNLGALREYKPMIASFWRDGLFESMDLRYLRLIDRTVDMKGEIVADAIDKERITNSFRNIFNNPANTGKNAYLDKMMHFDFKCLLPALLQVEDRMSAAFGIETRVPFMDHRLIEFLAQVPALTKFKDGIPKRFLKNTFSKKLPKPIVERRDKMGFPVPLSKWFNGPLSDWLNDTMLSQKALERPYIEPVAFKNQLYQQGSFSRNIWGLLSLELWQRKFIDRSGEIRKEFS